MSEDKKFVEEDSPEWDYMWAKLAQHPLNRDQEEPTLCDNDGEVWEYMGTELLPNGQWSHKFRHRMHPANDDTYTYVDILTSFDQVGRIRRQ